MINKGISGKYHGRIDVNNQLAIVHDKLKSVIPYTEIKCDPFNFEYDAKLKIYKCENAIPLDLAMEVREFIAGVPLDLSAPHLNDTDNKPLDNIIYDICTTISLSCNSLQSDWKWENYASWNNQSIWRLVPLTLNNFANSPIRKLIDLIEAKWLKTDMNILSLKKTTWVIQLIYPGHGIGRHSDHCSNRQISFLYYLTPDNWSIEKDGGQLEIWLDGKIVSVCPLFNSMIMWPMILDGGPMHSVAEVKAPISRPRIALVGFYYI